MRALSIGSTGMLAQQLNVEVISNNIANLSTTGFKRVRAEFQDMLYENMRRVGSTSSDAGTVLPSGLQVGLGVKPVATYRIHEQGSLIQTGNEYDLAISGKGFFQVQMPDGTTSYTRAGSLQIDSNGQIVTPDGYPILPIITVPNNTLSVTISKTGDVTAEISGQTAVSNLGQIQLARFVNPAGLESVGDNLMLETDASGAPIVSNPGTDGTGTLSQKYVEEANVNVVTEITTLISAQRAYEMNSRVIKAAEEMLTTASQMV